MKRLVHLSDLHFGRDRPEVLGPLLTAIKDLQPDLVVISGDLTQRATEEQFQSAAQFIKGIGTPVLTIPGNHDVPLHNVLIRVLIPWRRYRRWINTNLEPTYEDDEITVAGVNTVNPLAWQRGWLKSATLKRVCQTIAASKDSRIHVLVVHHPLEHLPDERKQLMHGASEGIQRLAESGADVVLSGHLHSWRVETFAVVEGQHATLQVQAGTSLSNRLRGEVNDFNLLEIESDHIKVVRHAYDDAKGGFAATSALHFRASANGWH